MLCPYCASEVPQAALVCPHCTRDFYLFKPLLERIDQLEKRIAEQGQTEARIAALESELAALKARSRFTAPNTISDSAPSSAGAPPPRGAARRYSSSLLLVLVAALLALVAAHIVLLFVYDVKPLYLRIASILIPIPFGFALLVWHPQRLRASALAGFALAVAAVWLMLATTAYIDNVPVLPQSRRDVQEVLEYIASLGLAFLTGVLLGKLRYRRLQLTPEPSRLAVLLAELFSSNKEGELGVVRLANRINKTVAAFTPIATGAAAIYTGIKALVAYIG